MESEKYSEEKGTIATFSSTVPGGIAVHRQVHRGDQIIYCRRIVIDTQIHILKVYGLDLWIRF